MLANRLFLLLCASAIVAPACSSQYSSYVSYSLPPSVQDEISTAKYYYPDILTIGKILSTIELSSPSLSHAESVIDTYEVSSSSIVSYLFSEFEYPSQVTSYTWFEQEVYTYSTLAEAVQSIESIEYLHSSLASVQSALESVEQTDSSILTDLSKYCYAESPEVAYANQVIEEASLTSRYIFNTLLEVSDVVSSSPTVSYALSSLSYDVYTLPSTVVLDIESYITSPSTVPPSEVSYLFSYYSSVYHLVTEVTSFTYSHSSIDTDLVNYLSAAASVSSIGTAASIIVSNEMTTLMYQLSVMSSLSYYYPSIDSDLGYLSYLAATSATLAQALSYLEGTFYNSPEVAQSIYSAIRSPSSVTSPEKISQDEVSHQSFVTAVTEITSFEQAHPSYASTVSDMLGTLTTVFKTDRTVLTAYSYLSTAESPQYASASGAIASLSGSSAITVLNAISYVDDQSPTLSDAEYVIESYAYNFPIAASYLWSEIEYASDYQSSVSYFANLDASYTSLVDAMQEVYSAEQSYSQLASFEHYLISMASNNPSLLTQYYYFSYAGNAYSTIYW